jgi:DNA modification methylase
MADPYFSDDSLTLLLGDARTVLPTLDAGSVDCVVTSPPYFGLRDYEGNPEQIGLEGSPAEYVAALVDVFAEVRRVLAEDGTLWLNIGDSYSAGGQGGNRGGRLEGGAHLDRVPAPTRVPGFKPKNLLGVPWRVAFALQDAGWILRNAIVWHKPNAMPESVRDRLSTRHEMLFLLAKSRRYWFDLDPIREPLSRIDAPRPLGGRNKTPRHAAATDNTGWKDHAVAANERGRNPGDVWTIATTPLPDAHFAAFPLELPRRCIAAGCKPGGIVLDPFSGAGTTALAAQQLGRQAIGIDINAKYHDIALKRMADAPLPFLDGEAS